jgi:hypothetical protein
VEVGIEKKSEVGMRKAEKKKKLRRWEGEKLKERTFGP